MRTLYASIICVFFLACKGYNQEIPQIDKVDYLPVTSSISKSVDCFNVQHVTPSLRLAVLSLQGIVNRDNASIYTYVDQDKWALDLYKTEGYIEKDTLYTDAYGLLNKYKASIKGAVVYDPEKRYTVNLATNIAGVENRVIISPDMMDLFQEATGITDIKDLRDHNFPDALTAFRWYKENIFPLQNHQVLSVAKSLLFMYDVYRDYLVEFKIPVFWLPGKQDADYDAAFEQEITKLLSETPANIPVLGFWQGVEDGKDIGYREFDGVKLAGKYGKFTLVNTWVGNYSYHSGIKPGQTEYKQTLPRAKEFRKYDPSKKYVALIMNESGDAPCYFLYTGFYPRQWNDPERGEVAISYGITPSLRMLAPGILNNMYKTQTANDFFFVSISGVGYCYPFEGYCENTSDSAANLKEYFSVMTAKNMAIMDLDMLGVYTHTSNKWSEGDYKLAVEFMLPMPGLKTIVSGMHRMQHTAKDSHEMLGDSVSVHHTITFWSMDNLLWNDKTLDEAAVDHLEKEIKTYGADGNFIQAMFYSWHYGPRRLNLLRKRLEKEGYEFVTLNEFDHLWREAN
jgi:hypothetical protein